jgi:serine/threonine protein kinase
MSGSAKVWPLRDDYQKAALDPKSNLKDPRLHSMRVEMKRMGAFEVPFSRNGNFGAVYQFANKKKAYALKVFADSQPDRELRYTMIHRHLASNPPAPSLVSFSYEPNGIRVRGGWYPTLVMDWAEGETLRMYLRHTFERGGQVNNGLLCRAWAQVMRELGERRTAHGDLQHGNILVMPNGSMKLVDYDGMFVPDMRQAGMTATEFGMAAYQHPKRYRGYFDERLDDFAGLVILLTLGCVNSARWQHCHNDDSYLLVKEADLLRPDQSGLMAELISSADKPIKKLAVMLKRAAQGEVDAIPPFAHIVSDPTISQLFDPSWHPSDVSSYVKPPARLVAAVPQNRAPEYSPIQPRCIWCQEVIRPGVQFCLKCGRFIASALRQPMTVTKRCSYCSADIPDSDQFCRKCGQSLSGPLYQSSVPATQCVYCRAALLVGDHFCRKCGKSISENLPNPYLSIQQKPGDAPGFNVLTKQKRRGWGFGKIMITTLVILFVAFMIAMFIVSALDIDIEDLVPR